MSDYSTAEVRKRIGAVDEYGCICCDVSICCGELPDALDEIERLELRIESAIYFIHEYDTNSALAKLKEQDDE
jgi:hypothetical protein